MRVTDRQTGGQNYDFKGRVRIAASRSKNRWLYLSAVTHSLPYVQTVVISSVSLPEVQGGPEWEHSVLFIIGLKHGVQGGIVFVSIGWVYLSSHWRQDAEFAWAHTLWTEKAHRNVISHLLQNSADPGKIWYASLYAACTAHGNVEEHTSGKQHNSVAILLPVRRQDFSFGHYSPMTAGSRGEALVGELKQFAHTVYRF